MSYDIPHLGTSVIARRKGDYYKERERERGRRAPPESMNSGRWKNGPDGSIKKSKKRRDLYSLDIWGKIEGGQRS